MSHISRFGNLYHRRSQRRQNNKNNSFFSKIIIFFAGKYAKCYRLIHFSPLFHFLTTLSKIESLFNLSLCSRYRSFFFFLSKTIPQSTILSITGNYAFQTDVLYTFSCISRNLDRLNYSIFHSLNRTGFVNS